MTDSEILDLFHSPTGREKAFKLLVEKYQQKVYWHIRRIVLEHEHANDVMQNTFVKVWKGLENFRAESQLFIWMYRIATNEALNFLNTHKKHQHISFDGPEDDDETSYSPSNYIKAETENIDSEKLLSRLKAAIESLPEKQRIVFNLRYYDEMPYEQMSEVLNTSVGALKASYFHAAQKIEKFLLAAD
ncbi:MAG: sigma-70 family RNA polymerase sigma factor [Chitinophagales bacterium]